MPDKPGVCLWRHDGQAAHVGITKSLRDRAWHKHLGGGLSLAGSSLLRNVCDLLFGIPLKVRSVDQAEGHGRAGDRDPRLAARCELSWLPRARVLAADQFERRLRAAYLPPLDRV